MLALTGALALSACSSGSTSGSATSPTIGNVNCQSTPSKCIPYVTATTVPSTYGCSGTHHFAPHQVQPSDSRLWPERLQRERSSQSSAICRVRWLSRSGVVLPGGPFNRTGSASTSRPACPQRASDSVTQWLKAQTDLGVRTSWCAPKGASLRPEVHGRGHLTKSIWSTLTLATLRVRFLTIAPTQWLAPRAVAGLERPGMHMPERSTRRLRLPSHRF